MQMPARGRKENRGTQRPNQATQQARQGRIDSNVNQDALMEAGEELGLDAQQVNQLTQGNRHDQKARQNRAERRRQQ